MSMTRQAEYERVAAYFHKLAWFAMGIAALGALSGLAAEGTQPRTVIWVIAGILTVGTLAISLVQSRRYRRVAELAGGSKQVSEDQGNG